MRKRLWFYRRVYSIRPAYCGTLVKCLFRFKREPLETSRGVFFIDPCSHFGLTLLEHGVYDDELTRMIEAILHPGSVFVDVGANEGYFSIVASRLVGNSGKVLAVEPQSRLTVVLDRNISLNRLGNVTLSKTAISDSEGRAELYLAPDTNTGSTGLVNTRRYPVPHESVRLVKLGRLLDENRLGNIDMMKMDIEGFEYEAIFGSPEVFQARRVNVLALELHHGPLTKRGKSPTDVTSFLKAAGYSIHDHGSFLIAKA